MNKKMALATRYGKNDIAIAVVVTIVNKKKKKLLNHKTFYVKDYNNTDEITDIIIRYAEKNNAEPLELSDKLVPVEELEKKCPKCGESIVRVPW